MKTLYLNRHAKSSWENPGLSDFDRPLNNRGKRDAPLMGKVLSEKVKSPQVIYSSPAKRAISTAKQIAESFGYSVDNIIQEQKIYEAVVSDIIKIISSTSDEYDTIMFFGHNPTFTMISNYLSHKYIDNLPTCGFVQINFDLEKWNEIEGNTGKLILFEYPKKHLK
jgi:phosphohistidine phosphatase